MLWPSLEPSQWITTHVFIEQYRKSSLNYPCYPFLFGALPVRDWVICVSINITRDTDFKKSHMTFLWIPFVCIMSLYAVVDCNVMLLICIRMK